LCFSAVQEPEVFLEIRGKQLDGSGDEHLQTSRVYLMWREQCFVSERGYGEHVFHNHARIAEFLWPYLERPGYWEWINKETVDDDEHVIKTFEDIRDREKK